MVQDTAGHEPVSDGTASLHHQPSSTASNPDVFSDDYAVPGSQPDAAASNPAPPDDGPIDTGNQNSRAQDLESPFDDSRAINPVDRHAQSSTSRRSSTDSVVTLQLQQQNVVAAPQRPPPHSAIGPSDSQTSLSTISRFSVPGGTSPDMGPNMGLDSSMNMTGPSHDYGMYSQDVGLTRVTSSSTISTTRPTESAPLRATAPQHPYLMYPQSTAPEELMEQTPIIPIGFPGRQLAMPPQANETGDIIGPDGHTETLPPYSRYAPEDVKQPTGLSDAGSAPAVPPPTSLTAVSGVAASSPLETSGSSSDAVPQSAQPSDALLYGDVPSSDDSDEAVHESGSTTRRRPPPPPPPPPPAVLAAAPQAVAPIAYSDPSGAFKEQRFRDRVKEVGRRKAFCGISIFMVAGIACIFLGSIALAGLVGGILGNRRGVSSAQAARTSTPTSTARPSSSVSATLIDSLDASPVSTVPAGLPSLIPGSYDIHLGQAKQKSACMNSKYSKFWQCRQDANVPVSVGNDAFSGDSTIGFESPVLSADFYYGPQDPFFRQKYHNLTMGIELSKPELGPGLYFETEIDKLIIVPASMISASESSDSSDSSSSQKSLAYRDSSARNAAWVGQESRVGDKPWFCWWNSTVYEFFIFLNDTAPDDALPTRTTSAVATTMTTTKTLGGPSSSSSSSESVFMAMATPTTVRWPSTTLEKRSEESQRQVGGRGKEEGRAKAAVTGLRPSPTVARRDAIVLPSLFNYPVRMIERRPQDAAVTPYCMQMQVLANGIVAPTNDYTPLADDGASTGAGARATATAQASSVDAGDGYQRRSLAHVRTLRLDSDTSLERRQDSDDSSSSSSDCFCQWFNG